ncbi:MAG: effector-associated domain EAD1-containing protein [Rhizonema sp. PD38]|nr:effector-associated domain EAD1-containing protein [Rhizonema sp. PD38]
MKLSGDERCELSEALLDAYPSYNPLEIMVSFQLEENLEAIAGRGKLEEVVFKLINWAGSQGKLRCLIEAAYEKNPGNLKLKAFYQKQFPFYSPIINIITSEQWNDIREILSEIDYDILQETCRKTLRNIKNIEGHVPQIINIKNLGILKEILLEKYPLIRGDIPTILEFAERLAKNKQIVHTDKEKIESWLKKIANEKNIKLPIYTEIQPSSSTVHSHLLIIIEKASVSDKFTLQAELMPNYEEKNEFSKTEPIYSDEDGLIICNFDEIKEKIYQFIKNVKLMPQYRKHTLTIELFLPIDYLEKNLDLEEICAGNNQLKAIGYQYQFVTRCLKRYLITEETNYGDFLTKLEEKWHGFQDFVQNNFVDAHLQDNFVYLDNNHIIEVEQWDEFSLANEWEKEHKIALNIAAYFPDNIEKQEKILNCILRGGIPISLWHKCPKLTCDEIRQQLADILTTDSLKKIRILLKNVWDTRKHAQDKYTKDKATARNQVLQPQSADYFGYQLGFLCDHPYRVPSRFKYDEGGNDLIGYD